ncbi:unnamed protein product [Calicophoron daubneyi]|uniref:Protein sarah n=1 Tax=Calicophoron daubneyi TaxID=300641 RepID=A0AAV2TN70_CALDB
MDSHIKFIQEQLAKKGSIFSYKEIEDILKVVQDVHLKLIITNVPKEVYSSQLAQNAFESLFKSFDSRSTFYYLPSFNRAQVYMHRPEGALCARLQVQGWKLPDSVLAQLPQESLSSPQSEGISCYIDQVDDTDESESGDEESDPAFECTCGGSRGLGPIEDTASFHLEDKLNGSKRDARGRHSSQSSLSQLLNPILASTTTPQCIPLDTRGSSTDRPAELRGRSAEVENASEASGDDWTTASSIPFFGSPPPSIPICLRHRNRRPKKVDSKHLAPPKPPRLFLLSPPASPPVGWEPKVERQPVINYELLEALASLAPGEAFEIQPRSEDNSHPSIVITPCESRSAGSHGPIVHTPCPQRKKM